MQKTNKEINPLKRLEQNFTIEMLNDTLKYQNQYGFNKENKNSAWNNEADAFRHAYMQSILAKRYGIAPAKIISNLHEHNDKQDFHEANMDLWNNMQGQEIYNEICKEYPNFSKLSKQQQKDIVALKVYIRMKTGQLITTLDDARQFKKFKSTQTKVSQENNKDTYTLPIEKPNNKIQIDKNKHSLIQEKFKYQVNKFTYPFMPTRNVGRINNNGVPLGFAADIIQLAQEFGLQSLSQNLPYLHGYKNPFTGNNRIFTREEIGAMSKEEFAKYEKEIDAQTKAFNGTMPTNSDLQKEAIIGGSVVYVNSYTRTDGTKVKGYYRSKPNF